LLGVQLDQKKHNPNQPKQTPNSKSRETQQNQRKTFLLPPRTPTQTPNTNPERGEEGVSLRRTQNDDVLYGGFSNFIFYFNKGILVTLHLKTTSFWVFYPF
jgi:hypothetical protein